MYLDYRESEAAAPVDIARTFIEARDAWDAEATAALFAPDAVINDLQYRSLPTTPSSTAGTRPSIGVGPLRSVPK